MNRKLQHKSYAPSCRHLPDNQTPSGQSKLKSIISKDVFELKLTTHTV